MKQEPNINRRRFLQLTAAPLFLGLRELHQTSSNPDEIDSRTARFLKEYT